MGKLCTHGSSGSSRLRPVLIFLVGALLYAGSPSNDFAFDARTAVRDNPIVRRGDLAEIWTSDYWAGFHGDRSGLYRPLTVLTWAVDYRIAGAEAAAYHLIDLLLHGATALLLYGFCCCLTRRDDWAWWSGLIFAAHPVQSEAVASLVGRADMLAALGCLAALWLHLKEGWRARLCAALALGAGLLSKESAVAFFALVLLTDLFQYRTFSGKCYRNGFAGQPPEGDPPQVDGVQGGMAGGEDSETALRALWRCHGGTYALYAAVGLLYLGVRWWVLGGLTVPVVDRLDNPLVTLGPALRLLNATEILFRYLGLLLLPVHLAADYSWSALPLADALWSADALLAGCGLAGLAGLLVVGWRCAPWLGFGLGWFLLALGPVANLLLPIGTIMAERLLYLPAAGFAMGTAALLGNSRRPGWIYLLVLLYAAITVDRVRDWRDDYTLFGQAVRVQPNSARAWSAFGSAALARGEEERGLAALERALEIFPDYYEVYGNLGHFHYGRGEYGKAQEGFEKGIRIRDDYPPLWLNAGLARYRLGDRAGARKALARAIVLDPRYVRAHFDLGVLLLEEGELEEAAQSFANALSLEPDHAQARFNLEQVEAALLKEKRE